MSSKAIRQLALWLFAFVLAFFVIQSLGDIPKREMVSYSEFKRLLAEGKVDQVVIGRESIRGTYKGPQGEEKRFRAIALADAKLIETLESSGVKNFEGEAEKNWISALLLNFGWIILFFGAWYFLIARQMQVTGRQALSFGRSRAKLVDKKKQKVTFNDVAGCDETKEELEEVIDF